MTLQAVAWIATILGWSGSWIIGTGHRAGWAIAVICNALWLAVNVGYGITAGIVSAVVAGGIAARNVRR